MIYSVGTYQCTVGNIIFHLYSKIAGSNPTLEYLITVQHLLNVHNGICTRFQMACKKGQFVVVEQMVNDQFKNFSINLNVPHVNGMTSFDLALSLVIR